MGTEGSVAFQFKRMGVFRLSPEAAGKDLEALELDLIDHGLEEMGEGTSDKGEQQIVIRCASPTSASCRRRSRRGASPCCPPSRSTSPRTSSTLPEDKATEVLELVDALEQDEDVQRVFHNLG